MRDTDLLTTAESAVELGNVPDYVRRLARQGRIPVAVVVGRGQRLYRRADIQKFAAERAARRTVKETTPKGNAPAPVQR
jgi:excisionase family DNA binding protein